MAVWHNPRANIPVFIRQKPWCECGRSCNTATGRFEAGLSVYECKVEVADEGRWRPTGAAWEKWGTNALRADLPWFLVTGHTEAGHGGDQEPLFESLTFVCHLEWDTEAESFVRKDEGPSYTGNHEGHPDCKCDGGIEYLKRVQAEMYGSDDGEDDDAEAEDSDAG